MGKGYSEQSLQAGCNASYLYSDRNTRNVSKNLGHLKAENSLSRQRWPIFSYSSLRNRVSIQRWRLLTGSDSLGGLQQDAVFESCPAQFICGSNALTDDGPADLRRGAGVP